MSTQSTGMKRYTLGTQSDRIKGRNGWTTNDTMISYSYMSTQFTYTLLSRHNPTRQDKNNQTNAWHVSYRPQGMHPDGCILLCYSCLSLFSLSLSSSLFSTLYLSVCRVCIVCVPFLSSLPLSLSLFSFYISPPPQSQPFRSEHITLGTQHGTRTGKEQERKEESRQGLNHQLPTKLNTPPQSFLDIDETLCHSLVW